MKTTITIEHGEHPKEHVNKETALKEGSRGEIKNDKAKPKALPMTSADVRAMMQDKNTDKTNPRMEKKEPKKWWDKDTDS